MKQPFIIRISEPCHERWDEMTPTARGAHCAACSREVIDFSHRTDHYIYQTLQGRTDVCGRFLTDQVGRPIAAPERHLLPSYMRRIAATVVSLFTLYKAAASTSDEAPRVDTTIHATDSVLHLTGETAVHSDACRTLLSGYVRDQVSHQPIANASIRIVGSRITVYSDIDGYFAFDTLPQRTVQVVADSSQRDTTSAYTWISQPEDTVVSTDTIRLLVKNGRYRSQYISIAATESRIDILMLKDTLLNEVCVTGGVYMPLTVGYATMESEDPKPYFPPPAYHGLAADRPSPLPAHHEPQRNDQLTISDRCILWLRQRKEAAKRWMK